MAMHKIGKHSLSDKNLLAAETLVPSPELGLSMQRRDGLPTQVEPLGPPQAQLIGESPARQETGLDP